MLGDATRRDFGHLVKSQSGISQLRGWILVSCTPVFNIKSYSLMSTRSATMDLDVRPDGLLQLELLAMACVS